MFKKEISIDYDEESIDREKQKKKLGSVKPPIKEKYKLNNSTKKYNNLISLNKNRNKHKIIFENKNIIINDITKNYGTNITKTYHDKKKISIINKLSKDINSKNNSKYKYESIKTESKLPNNNHTTRETNKLNLRNNNEVRKSTNINRTTLKHRQSKPLLKSSFNEKIIQCMEKKKTSKNFDNINKKKKITFRDSYEFNFTFNNYNSNFTYNNTNEILKEDKKKTNKILIENLSKENIINKFKSIKPSSIRNNILGGLKNILNKNMDNTNTNLREKNEKMNKKDINYYVIKIQKMLRGYNFRKNNRMHFQNQNNTSNFRVYIRKKILSNRRGLNSNINNTENNLIYSTYFKERSQYYLNESKKAHENENKIQEIIIDKKKIINVLNPSSQRNKIKEIHISNCSFKNNIINKKKKLLKYFNYWNNITNKKLIVQRLIEYFRNKRSFIKLNNFNTNIKSKNDKNKTIRYYKRNIYKNNYFIK